MTSEQSQPQPADRDEALGAAKHRLSLHPQPCNCVTCTISRALIKRAEAAEAERDGLKKRLRLYEACDRCNWIHPEGQMCAPHEVRDNRVSITEKQADCIERLQEKLARYEAAKALARESGEPADIKLIDCPARDCGFFQLTLTPDEKLAAWQDYARAKSLALALAEADNASLLDALRDLHVACAFGDAEFAKALTRTNPLLHAKHPGTRFLAELETLRGRVADLEAKGNHLP